MPEPNTEWKDSSPELDDAMILKAMNGDTNALAAIYDAYAPRIFRYFYSRVENTAEADDLSAETFLKVIEALPRYRHRGQFTAWIFQIARNKAMDFFRRNHKTPINETSLLKDGGLERIIDEQVVDDLVINQQVIAALRRHIRDLEEGERELLRLRFVANLTYAQIAEMFGRKEDAVRKAMNGLIERLYWQVEVSRA